jgi:hypothetical protein
VRRGGPIDEWHADLEKPSQWRNWVATHLAQIQEKSEI